MVAPATDFFWHFVCKQILKKQPAIKTYINHTYLKTGQNNPADKKTETFSSRELKIKYIELEF